MAEDTPSFDYGGYVVGDVARAAILWAKSPGILAGRPFVDEIFAQCGCAVSWTEPEGAVIPPAEDGSVFEKKAMATVTGPACGLLRGERVALNVLARCSGVATATARVVGTLRAAGYKGIVAGTRKTTPGFRLVEKYGMLVGGADMHRVDLSSMVMLKDNHVWSRGSIAGAVRSARAVAGFSLKVEVEVRSVEEAREAVEAGADVVMLDNFDAAGARVAASTLRAEAQAAGASGSRFLIEVSGGLTLDNVAEYAASGKW